MFPSSASIRRRLQSVVIRQTARKAFDLSGFGTGPVERIVTSLVLGAAFFMLVLGVQYAIGVQVKYAVASAVLAFVSAMAASATLVLWTVDDAKLAWTGVALRGELAAAEVEEADAEAMELEEAAKRDTRRRNAKAACGYCGGEIPAWAAKCRHCGEYLDDALHARAHRPTVVVNNSGERKRYRGSPAVAAVLSFFPGWGHIYRGRILDGLAWGIIVPLSWLCCCVPGAAIHVICMMDAASD